MARFSVLLNVEQPQISITKHHEQDNCECRFLQIVCNGDNDQILLRFVSMEDLEAYYGLLGIALGKTK